jgi:SAM-dependent MidA family methyltransferase
MKLPLPDPIAQAHSEKLSSLIQDEIQAQEFISFARFMELALYAPGLGYYSAGAHKLGAKGDFTTAPEMTPLFAQCLAHQCQEVLSKLDEGDILELGAGSGVLARDLLQELERLNSLPKRYLILETSADLRERQQALLKTSCPHLFSRIHWLDSLPNEKITGMIIANEVLDALPVHCFQIENQQVRERCVTTEQGQFTWKVTAPLSNELTTLVNEIQAECPLDDGYESEANLLLSGWINGIADTLKEGVILFFDYGYGRREYYHPDRSQGTLMCYYQHHKHSDPFQLVGLQDITAHVDFTQVADSAIKAGLSLKGYTTQSAFLLACGLLNLAKTADTLDEIRLYQQNQAIKTLTLPSQMGEAVKVIALGKAFTPPLVGFSLHNRIRDL